MLVVGEWARSRGGDRMRFAPAQQPLYGGIALHARRLYGAILPQDGESLLHRNMHASPATFRTAIALYRAAMVVAVAGLFTWDWLADLGAQEGIPLSWGMPSP